MLFTKMHGLGNDFIVIEDYDSSYDDYSKVAVEMCDRHFGIGGDGLLIVKKSETADSKMLIFNSDGSQAEMCGNGIRCFAKYLFDNELVNDNIMQIETLDGIKEVAIETQNSLVKNVKVNMGNPLFNTDSIPIKLDCEQVVNTLVKIGGEEYSITSMLMGVPHTVLFVDNINAEDMIAVGKRIENSSFFPKKTNVNFVKVISKDEFSVRTWERGAGLTLACGTGTCASLVACVLNKKTARKAKAYLFGGDLLIEWHDSGEVYMTGPAETVFTGEYKISL